MSELKPSRRPSLAATIVPGFLFILLVSGLFLAMNARQTEELSNAIRQSQDIAKKFEAVAVLVEIVRRRTNITLLMTNTVDPFKRDELFVKLNQQGGRFANLRARMLNGWLNKQEKSVLIGQDALIRQALAIQKQLIEMLFRDDEGDRQRAADMLINKLYPIQIDIINRFIKLLNLLESEELELSEHSIKNLKSYEQTYRVMVLLVILAAAGLGYYMLKKIRHAELSLAEEKERAQVTLRSIDDAVISVNRNGQISYANPRALDAFQIELYEMTGANINDFLHQMLIKFNEPIQQYIERTLTSDGFLTAIRDYRVSPKANPQQVFSVSISPIKSANEQVNGLAITMNDITEADALLKKNQYMATHDVLTRLYNRLAFEKQVKRILKNYDSQQGHMFCVIDLDQFKIVNDTAGHAAGDELLRQLANSMKPIFRDNDILCRLGGDEFGVFMMDISHAQAEQIMQQLLAAISGFGFSWKENLYRISASIGMVRVDSGLIDYDDLFQAADLACYMAKNEGRNQLHFMPPNADLLAQRSEEAKRLKYLTQALEKGENLVLFEQAITPISKCTEGRQHAEVLLRMRAQDGAIISPMAFIPIAERYGLMSKVDCWVLRQVCQHILATPLESTIYAVNLSGQSLSSKEIMKELVTIIFESRIPPGRLCIEVTETVAIANLEVAKRFLIVLQEHGCFIALDDFGSGLSSFAYLSKMPLDYLKIDGVFIRSILQDRASLAMVESIHYVARKMGLMTIAEYVEDEAMVTKLKEIGIDMAQGYYYDKPHEMRRVSAPTQV